MTKTGEFNLDFPGATLICDTEQKKEALKDYLNGKADVVDINFNDVASAIYNTTYIHEGKHLHDFLTCPMLVHNYSLKLSALYYAVLALDIWNKGVKPYKYIPLPFTSWIELPKEKQLELIRKKGITEYDVPVFSLKQAVELFNGKFHCDNAFAQCLLLGALHYSEYNYNMKLNEPDSYNTEYSIKTFLESMAFVCQMTDVAIQYGKDGENIAQNILKESFNNFSTIGRNRRETQNSIAYQEYIGYSTYTSMFTLSWRYAIQTKINIKYVYPFISYVLFWALSGNVLYDKKEACSPRNRIERLFNLDYLGIDIKLYDDSVIKDLFANPLDTYKKWDEFIALTYSKTNYHIIQETGGSYCINTASSPIELRSFYSKIMDSLNNMSNFLLGIGYSSPADYISNITSAIRIMSEYYINNASLYLYPELYIANLNRVVNIPFRIHFVGINPINEKDCPFLKNGIKICNDGIYGNSLLTEYGKYTPDILDWEKYRNAKDYIDISNILFSKTNIDKPGHIIRERLPDIKPWFF